MLIDEPTGAALRAFVERGGTLITVPTLVYFGLPATMANGTNRVGLVLQTFFAIQSFRREGFDHRNVITGLVPGGAYEQLHAHGPECIGELRRPVCGIDVHLNQAGASSRKLDHRPLDAVGRPDANSITLLKS